MIKSICVSICLLLAVKMVGYSPLLSNRVVLESHEFVCVYNEYKVRIIAPIPSNYSVVQKERFGEKLCNSYK